MGSSPLLLQRGLTESLAGRFELTPVRHWSFSEMQDAFVKAFKPDKVLLVGGDGLDVAMFLSMDVKQWLP